MALKLTEKFGTKKLAMSAIGVAFMFVVTSFLQIPMFGIGAGYIHLGDTVLFIVAFICGPLVGGITGGFGGFFADLFLGYPSYALFTLVIKAVQGAIVGGLAKSIFCKSLRYQVFKFLGILILSGTFMIVGYFLVNIMLFDWSIVIVSLVGDVIQILTNIIFASLAFPSICRYYNAIRRENLNLQIDDELNSQQ
jgi:uncharacterized membrane protein